MSYAQTHANALRLVTRKGSPITFTLTSPGTLDPATDHFSGATVTSVSGSAVQDNGDPEQYAQMGLTMSDPRTLWFEPTTYGQEPPLSATCVWGTTTYTVKNVRTTSPDGTMIGCYVVVSR